MSTALAKAIVLLCFHADWISYAAWQELSRVKNLGTVDVAAVRLWLDKRVQAGTASNVMARFDDNVGATFFDLNSLQASTHFCTLFKLVDNRHAS